MSLFTSLEAAPLPKPHPQLHMPRQPQDEDDPKCRQKACDSPTSDVRVRRVLLEDIQPWQGLT